MLITNYIRSAWRNILRHKLFSIINILGLAIGLAAVMLIALYVRYETSYDSFWKNADNIYRVHMQSNIPDIGQYKFTKISVPAFNTLKEAIPEIESGTRIIKRPTILQYQDTFSKQDIELVDEGFLNVFDLTPIAGSLSNALSASNTIILTKSTANKYFENNKGIGETFTIDFDFFKQDYIVTAIVEDLPKNSQLDISALVMFEENKWVETVGLYRFFYAPVTHAFYTMKEGTDISLINQRMSKILDQYFEPFPALQGDAVNSEYVTFPFLNIKDLHLKAEGIEELKPRGSTSDIINFSLVAVIILIIAAINFMNLSTARASNRAKEVSVRKVVGAKRNNLIQQFLGESIIMTLLSLFLAVSLLEVLLPFFSDFLNAKLNINYLNGDLSIIFTLAIIIGLIAGFYPAFVLSSYRPAQVLKTNKSTDSPHMLIVRNILVITQFSAAIALITTTGVIYSQILYTSVKDLGFNKENILIIEDTDNNNVVAKQSFLIEEIKKISGVVDVTASYFAPGKTNEIVFGIRTDNMARGSAVPTNGDGVSYDFFSTYQIPLIAGREYDRARNDIQASYDQIKQGNGHRSPILINKASVEHFGFSSPEAALGKSLYMQMGSKEENLEREQFVVGVVSDFHTYSLKQEIAPTIYYLTPDSGRIITLRYQGNPANIISKIEKLWKLELPNSPFTYNFVSDLIADQYNADLNIAITYAAFSGLAIFIACLGLFGLASFTAERRTKEIGIRKVFGAEVWQIVRMLVFQFSKPVLIANVIAWPVAYLAMSRWLESFVYRIDDMVIIALCLVAGLTALLIAWATVAGNSYAVARQNPIKALRYE